MLLKMTEKEKKWWDEQNARMLKDRLEALRKLRKFMTSGARIKFNIDVKEK